MYATLIVNGRTARVYAMALSFCLLMLIMHIMQIMQMWSFVCLLPTRTCRAMATAVWPRSAIVLATVSGRSAARPRDHGCSRCFLLREKFTHASGGGLLVAPINVPHTCLDRRTLVVGNKGSVRSKCLDVLLSAATNEPSSSLKLYFADHCV